MELSLKPHHKNLYPPGGYLIKGTQPAFWLQEIARLTGSIEAVTTYPIPGLLPNSVWGCLVVPKEGALLVETSLLSCQVIRDRIFLPQHSMLFPELTKEELDRFFPDSIYFLHPEVGFACLEAPLDWTTLPEVTLQDLSVIKPAKGIDRPGSIHGFSIAEQDPEQALKQLEEKTFDQQVFADRPLSFWEQIKRRILAPFFKNGDRKENEAGSGAHTGQTDSSSGWSLGRTGLMEKLRQHYEDLEERNQKEIDKLMKLLEKDPDEALKYAIPLDDSGVGRSSTGGQVPYQMSKMRSNFSLFNKAPGSGGGAAVEFSGDQYMSLRQQYLQTAQDLIRREEYQKAAFVYLKLLKDYQTAAQTLEQGEMYGESASVYLKYLNDNRRAAISFEKGKMYGQAIPLYQGLTMHEKAGDLYMEMGKREEAMASYEQVVEQELKASRYLKAADLLETKMGAEDRAQATLLDGWVKRVESSKCLDRYVSKFQNEEEIFPELEKIYRDEHEDHRKKKVLQVLIQELGRKRASAPQVRELSYEIIAGLQAKDQDILSELKSLNPEDALVLKDVFRYKAKGRKR